MEPDVVRAKFTVTKTTHLPPWGSNIPGEKVYPVEVSLQPVYSSTGENAIFGKATPSGDCRMVIQNPAAAAFFQPGEEYYFDITRAPKAEAANG